MKKKRIFLTLIFFLSLLTNTLSFGQQLKFYTGERPVNDILCDANGVVWLATQAGLVRFAISSTNDSVFLDNIKPRIIENYAEFTGVVGSTGFVYALEATSIVHKF